jgi:hypothetical protein
MLTKLEGYRRIKYDNYHVVENDKCKKNKLSFIYNYFKLLLLK